MAGTQPPIGNMSTSSIENPNRHDAKLLLPLLPVLPVGNPEPDKVIAVLAPEDGPYLGDIDVISAVESLEYVTVGSVREAVIRENTSEAYTIALRGSVDRCDAIRRKH
jgi:hypothetical protein